jgi:hypothetical protein
VGMPELAGFCGDSIVDMMVLEGWIVLLRLTWHLHDSEAGDGEKLRGGLGRGRAFLIT